MAEQGQTIQGIGGFRLRILTLSDELLEMEAHYAGDGNFPPVHLHPQQEEHFEVVSGRMLTLIDGDERTYDAGNAFDVPAGTPHTMKADGPTVMNWKVTPSMRTAEFFERAYAAGGQNAMSAEEAAAFLEEFKNEFRAVGPPPQE
jgi:mannose-6-phosphate isomerase-like protein (cupin superfamily)